MAEASTDGRATIPRDRENAGSVAVMASVGHSIWPDEGRTTDALLREADAAMYRDKLRA
jgi:predicted signal transduction protein with EAL and GGDEF domain